MKIIRLLFFIFLSLQLSAQSKKELEEQIVKLNADIQLLNTNNQLLNTELTALKNVSLENTELKNQILKLNADIQQLNIDLTSSKNTSQEYNQKKEEYSAKLDECRTKYELCVEDKEKMMERQNTLMTQNQELVLKIDSLKFLSTQISTVMITNPKNAQDSIRMTLQQYKLTASITERIQMVDQKNSTISRMKIYYSSGIEPKEIKSNEIGFGNELGEYTEVFCDNSRYYVKKVNGKYLIDWEASCGYNDVSLAEYKVKKSPSVEVRVTARIENQNYYNYYGKESQYICFYLRDDTPGVYGYVLRNSAAGKKMYELLSDGEAHEIIVQLTPDRSEDESGDTNVITKLISESWLLK